MTLPEGRGYEPLNSQAVLKIRSRADPTVIGPDQSFAPAAPANSLLYRASPMGEFSPLTCARTEVR
jgi:hypothetical protein